jgi:hypothetical protein
MEAIRTPRSLLTVLILASTAVTGYSAESGSWESPAGRFYTVADPGPITNMIYRCRELSSDTKTLVQTRFWLQGQNVRLLREEAPNALATPSVSDVPDAVWDQMETVSEIIKTKQGAWARTWRLPEPSPQAKRESERLRHMLERKFGKENVTEKAVSLGKWYPSTADTLNSYILNVNPDAFKNRSPDDPVLKEGRIKSSRPNDAAPDHFIELEFDPQTFLKLRQRVFNGRSVIQDETWDTQVSIETAQFVISQEAVAGALGKPTEFVGIGLFLQSSDTGPFLIMSVYPDSPAMKAGIKKRGVLLSIDGRSTQGMSLAEVMGLLRGQVDAPVTVEVREPRTDTSQHFTLKREKIVSNGIIPPTKEEADESSEEIKNEMNKDSKGLAP